MSVLLIPLMPPLLLAGLLPQDGQRDAVSAELAAQRQLLSRVFEVHAEEDAKDQERALRGIDPPPLASLVELLALEHLPADWFAERASDEPLPLSPESLTALHGTLESLPLTELRPFFELVAADEPRLDRREVCVSVLGEVGRGRDLNLVIGLATPHDQDVRVLPRSLRKSYEAALRAILEREPGGLGTLESAFQGIHAGLASATIDAVSSVPSEDALTTLVALLGRVDELDAYILSTIARLGPQVRHPVPEGTLGRVRRFLFHANPGVVRAAVRAVGRLEDYEAIPQLLDMLSQTDGNLRTSAHVALGDITGLPFHDDLRIWKAWYGRESEWWRDESAAVFRDLESRNAPRVSEAVNEITRRHLFRHELAQALVTVLDREESELVVLACRGLGQLRSRVGLARLVDCLEHEDWSVRRSAWTVLVRITGRDLPPEIQAWQAEIDAGEL